MLFDQSLALVFPIIMIGDIGKKKRVSGRWEGEGELEV